MRVLAVVEKYPPVHNAGAEVMLHAMLRDLVGRGHDCIVTYERARATNLDGVKIVPGSRRNHDIVAMSVDCDVVISHLNVAHRGSLIASEAHRPFVQLVHNDAQVVPAEVADLVVWNSEWIRDRYRKWPGESIVVRPPVAFAEYDIGRRNSTTDVAFGDVTLVNLTQAKGARLLWDLAEAAPHRRFLGVRGAYGSQIEPSRKLRNVEVLAHLPAGQMRDEVYARTRVLLVPSKYESWGMAAIEACCAGIPVIASPTPGLRESLGSAGIFADRTRPRDWLAHLDRLDDPAEYWSASEMARARGVELGQVNKFDLEAFALRLEQLIGAYARPMSILGSSTISTSCPVCGARDCTCGDAGVRIRKPTRRGLPLRNYHDGGTVLRLNDDDARARGLLPPELDETPAPTTSEPQGDVPPVDGRIGEMLAWAGENDPERIRAAILAERADRNRPTLIAALERLLEEL